MKIAILGLFLALAACSKTPVAPVAPVNLGFSLSKTDGTTIDGKLDADAPASAKEYKSAVAVAVDAE